MPAALRIQQKTPARDGAFLFLKLPLALVSEALSNMDSPHGMQPGVATSQLMGPASYPLAYFNMPKAACTTIKNILYRIAHGEWLDKPLEIHRRIRYQRAVPTGRFFAANRSKLMYEKPFTSFTFVRDPGRRAYSAFIEKIWATGVYHIPGARRHLIENMGFNLPPLGEGEPSLQDVRTAFRQFLAFVKMADNRFARDAHWAGQHARIRNIGAEDCLNFIGRVESFARDMKLVLARAGWQEVEIADRRFNEGPRAPFAFDEVLDDEIAGRLLELYRDDYLAFGYAPPNHPISVVNSPVSAGFRGRVFVGRPDRLGMRVTMFLQAWRFAREIGYQTVVFWPPNEINREQDSARDSASYPIRDFIDVAATTAAVGDNSLIFHESWFPRDTTFVDSDSRLGGQFPRKFDRDRSRQLPGRICVRQLAVGLRFKDEKPEAVRSACVELFRKVVPAPEVVAALTILRAAVPAGPCLGLHIRRGDIPRTLRDRIAAAAIPPGEFPTELVRYIRMLASKTAPLCSYRKLISAQQAGAGSILLFTDSPELAEGMIRDLGATIPVVPVHETATPGANANQRSFAELLLLAQCSAVIGSRSAFSRAAHLIGGMPLHDASTLLGDIDNIKALLVELAGDLLADRPELNAWIEQNLVPSAPARHRAAGVKRPGAIPPGSAS